MIALLILLLLPAPKASAVDWEPSAQPAYSAAESVADGLYEFLGKPLSSLLFAGRLAPQLDAVPQESSYARFALEFRQRQDRAEQTLVESLSAGAVSPEWRGRMIRQETNVLTDAFARTMADRYGLRRLGRSSQNYAADPRNWDPEFLVSAAVVGGAYAYATGLRADMAVGQAQLDVDMKPGEVLRGAVAAGDGRQLASVRLSRKGSPLSLRTDWGLRGGHAVQDSLGLAYSRRF